MESIYIEESDSTGFEWDTGGIKWIHDLDSIIYNDELERFLINYIDETAPEGWDQFVFSAEYDSEGGVVLVEEASAVGVPRQEVHEGEEGSIYRVLEQLDGVRITSSQV